jgi:putative ABC transport system ATP-binding protein
MASGASVMDIVRVDNVTKIFKTGEIEVKALNGVSLTIEEGSFQALAGPSGSGKTTLLNLIGALDVPTSGQLWIEDANLSKLNDSQLSDLRLEKLGFVFQAYNLIPVLTAYENAEYVLLMQGVPAQERKQRVEKILEEVGLKDQMHKRPGEMSGGQQQRVAVARAIVAKPRLVLADEPTANLDSKTGAALLDLMVKLNEDHGVTFLFSTHDPMVMERARTIVHLKDGSIERLEHKEG